MRFELPKHIFLLLISSFLSQLCLGTVKCACCVQAPQCYITFSEWGSDEFNSENTGYIRGEEEEEGEETLTTKMIFIEVLFLLSAL